MKKTAILLLLALVGLTSTAQTIKWYSFEEAVALSKKQPKKIFIDVYTDWCGWCKVYDKNTFSDPEIAKYMNKYYYPVKLNAETRDTIKFQGHTFINPGAGNRSTHMLAASLLQGKMSYPSVVFMDEQFQVLYVLAGYHTPDQFAPFISYFAEEAYKSNSKTSWEDFNKTFKWPKK